MSVVRQRMGEISTLQISGRSHLWMYWTAFNAALRRALGHLVMVLTDSNV